MLGLAGLGLLLLGAGGAGGQPDDDDDDDDGGTPGGQEPPIDPDEPELPGDVSVVITDPIDWGDPVSPKFPTGEFPWVPWTGPGEEPWDPGQWEHPNNYPTPGTFHQIEYGDIFGGTGSAHNLAWACLYEAAYAAAVEVGGELDDAARAFAKSIAGKAANRARYRDLIQCSAWNDALYGTWGYSDKSTPGPHGRAIRLLPHHPDNRAAIFSRQSPLRNIRMKKPADKGQGGGTAIDPEFREGFEYLWLPALNLVALWESREITSQGMVWEDGSSMSNPPPEVWALDIDVLEDPGFDTFGCEEGEQTWS